MNETNPCGIWGDYERRPIPTSHPLSSPSSLDVHKGKIITLTALFAISLLAAGGGLFYFKVNTIAAWVLIGSGGVVAIGEIIVVVLFVCNNQREKKSTMLREENEPSPSTKNSSYHIISWDLSNEFDLGNLSSVNIKIENENRWTQAPNESGRTYLKNYMKRLTLFKEAFQDFGQPDILCLQNCGWMYKGDLKDSIPPGYDYFAFNQGNLFESHNAIAWNAEKFSKLSHASLDYRTGDFDVYTELPTPDIIVLLEDKINSTRICVDSACLYRDFSLASCALVGNTQARYDLDTMNEVDADLFVVAGNYNATKEHCPRRFEIIQDSHHYITDENDTIPTVFDENLKKSDGSPLPVKKDHIYVRAREKADVEIKQEHPPSPKLGDLRLPSTHLPIGARIIYKA